MKEVSHEQICALDALFYKVCGHFKEIEAAQGINGVFHKVIHALLLGGVRTQREITQEYKIPKQSVNKVISTLQKMGFLSLKTGSDRREKIVELNAAGVAFAAEFLARYAAFKARVAGRLGAKKFEQFLRLFGEFEAALSDELNAEISKNTIK